MSLPEIVSLPETEFESFDDAAQKLVEENAKIAREALIKEVMSRLRLDIRVSGRHLTVKLYDTATHSLITSDSVSLE